MSFELIALDIDGTLLNSRKEVSPETLQAVQDVCSANKTVVFDTGRAVCELTDLFELLPEVRYAVFASGAGIYDAREKQAFALHGISREDADVIFSLARTKDVMPQIVLADADVIQASHLDRLDHIGCGRRIDIGMCRRHGKDHQIGCQQQDDSAPLQCFLHGSLCSFTLLSAGQSAG